MPTQNPHPSLSASQFEKLQQQAIAVANHAYAPYSNFRVGAAILLTTTGHADLIVTGCNVENASYRLTTCAEQSAIASAISLHGPGLRIRAVVIANLNQSACQPCGACRQTIHEFSASDTPIFFPAADGSITEATIADLLPAAFLLKKIK